jgi:Tol biopolymer transport system component
MRLRRPEHSKLSLTIGLTAILLLMPVVLAAQEKIVFESERDGNPEIYIMNADGGNQTRMTFNSAFDTRPAFSPGGSKIVFTSSRDGNGEIYIMHADGSAQTNLSRNPALDDAPAFSPDGQRITFISNRAGQRDIWVMNVDGSSPKQLTNAIAGVDNPAFSPDGRKIVFQATGAGAYGSPDVFIMKDDGSNVNNLTNNDLDDQEPVFSRDGTRIVFASNRDGFSWEIYQIDVDGGNPVNLTKTPLGNQHYPALSPDGARITFNTFRDGDTEIYSMNADGTNQVNLTKTGGLDMSPSWGTANVAPVLSNVTVTPVVNEGGTVTLKGDISDENAEDSFTVAIGWGDGNGTSLNLPAGTTSFQATHVYPDDPPSTEIGDTYTVGCTVNDHRFGTDTDGGSVLVNNLDPVISAAVATPTPLVVGSIVTLSANYTDAGYHGSPMDEQLSARVQWGDGQSTQVVTSGAPGSILETHQYSAMGNYTITIEVFDNDAGHGIKTLDVVVSPPAPPAAPSGLRIDSIAINRIDIQWTDNSNNEDGFAVERCAQRGCNNFLEIGRVFPDNRHFVDGQLFANTQYYYRVRAFNAGGMSAYTDVVSAKTLRK